MPIGEMKIKKDLETMKKNLCFPKSMSMFSRDYVDFLSWSGALESINPSYTSSEIYTTPYIYKGLIKQDKSDEEQLSKTINEENEYITEMSENYFSILNDIGFIDFSYATEDAIYTYKEAKEMILAFFSTFDVNTYNIAKRALEEDKICFGTPLFDSEGCYYHIIGLNKSLILLNSEKFSLKTICILVHELGHYIETVKYALASKKPHKIYYNTFIELPSMFYEYEFLKFTLKNRINTRETNNMINIFHAMTNEYFKYYSELMNDDFEDIQSLLDSIIYSVGAFTTLHFSVMREEEPKEFYKIFGNANSKIGYCGLETIIESTGIDLEDFISGGLIEPIIKEDFESMKRQYKLKL